MSKTRPAAQKARAPRSRQARAPRSRQARAPRSRQARSPDAARIEALANEIESRLILRAFSFEDPASYEAGVRESAAALRDALERSERRSRSG